MTISDEDRKIILAKLKEHLIEHPAHAIAFTKAMDGLELIPKEAKKYTVQEIIDLLRWAQEVGYF